MASSLVNEHYHAIIDMGSNGIRFSISDLSPPTTRILPTIYQDRCGISLYDVQYRAGMKVPIPEDIIEEASNALMDFKRTCRDFGVQDSHVRLVATEATRNALNSRAYLRQIEEATGWKPELLSKEDEGRLGAMGIASSVNETINGLVMDMGGGSVQLTWMEKDPAGHIDLTCFRSYPYGAAALMSQFCLVSSQEEASPLVECVSSDLKSYFQDLHSAKPSEMKRAADEGLSIFLSGGGFRGWGHILMSLDAVQPYPIPIVNGYKVDGAHLLPDLTGHTPTSESHRISSRRSSQVPAVQFLIKAILKALGDTKISDATFCQGGVREGLLYDGLPDSIRSRNALDDAGLPHAPPSASALAETLSSALPGSGRHRSLIPAIVNLLYYHDSYPKDIRAAAALRSTTTGVLANTHGISHDDRALLALVLCERWGAIEDVPLGDRPFLQDLEALQGESAIWWARYLGCMAKGIAKIYPAGLVRDNAAFTVSASETHKGVYIAITPMRSDVLNAVQDWAKQSKKLGKKKNWVGNGENRWGLETEVDVILTNIH